MVLDQSNLVGAGSVLASVHSLFDQAEKQFKEGRQRKDLKTQQYEAKQAQEAGLTPRPVVELTLLVGHRLGANANQHRVHELAYVRIRGDCQL